MFRGLPKWAFGRGGNCVGACYLTDQNVTPDVLEQTTQVLGEIVAGIENGVFAPHPSALSTYLWVDCHVCNPDGLGTAELRKQWDRKRHDPALARYAALAEPLEEEVDA